MSAQKIDGSACALEILNAVQSQVKTLKANHQITPGLAVVLVGDDPASQIYVRSKARKTVRVGMKSFEHRLSSNTSEHELLTLLEQLNGDDNVDGILVQLPLPHQINSATIANAIMPEKDVDGFHVINSGKLAAGQDGLFPCTPLGCVILAKKARGNNLSGLEAVVVGRSNTVGKPLAQLLLRENCTVTIAHSKTIGLAQVCQRADLLFAAVGRPEMIKGDWVKPGATIIDVGINRITDQTGQKILVGDVDYHQAVKIAGAITPVPGGVGPMTIACLLDNSVHAALARRGLTVSSRG